MSDLISKQAVIDTEGLDEQIRCEMCRNPMHTDRGCDGNCKYDEKLYEKIIQILDERIKPLPSAHPETYKEKLNEIASALSEKFAYMNTCLNERDIILGYLGVKRSCETHCNTDCTNTKCESHPLSFVQPEIIRCKDCKWSEEYVPMCKTYYFCREQGLYGKTEEDFCSHAERREEGERE